MKTSARFLLLLLPLTLAGCAPVDSVTGWLDDEAPAEAAPAETGHKYVTVKVRDRYGFRIKDPLGRRTTGGSCGMWKDQVKDEKGGCCWTTRGECACPCPEPRAEEAMETLPAEKEEEPAETTEQ